MFNLKRAFNFAATAVCFGAMVVASAVSGLIVSSATGGNVAAGAVAAFATPFVISAILDSKSSNDKKQPKQPAPR